MSLSEKLSTSFKINTSRFVRPRDTDSCPESERGFFRSTSGNDTDERGYLHQEAVESALFLAKLARKSSDPRVQVITAFLMDYNRGKAEQEQLRLEIGSPLYPEITPFTGKYSLTHRRGLVVSGDGIRVAMGDRSSPDWYDDWHVGYRAITKHDLRLARDEGALDTALDDAVQQIRTRTVVVRRSVESKRPFWRIEPKKVAEPSWK